MRRYGFVVLAAALSGACVSLEETKLAKGAITPGQRTIVVVYEGPGPVIEEDDSKVEGAAKIIPGIGLVVQDAQEERMLLQSKDLQKYLGPFDATGHFAPALRGALDLTGHPGKWTRPEETDVPAESWKRLNGAKDVLEWRRRYFLDDPGGPLPRNYSQFLSLDDALVLEINLAYGCDTDGEGNAKPSAMASARLWRAGNMRLLWKRDEKVTEPPPEERSLYDYKVAPQELHDAYKRLLPQLAQQLATTYRRNLLENDAFVAPTIHVPGQNPEEPPQNLPGLQPYYPPAQPAPQGGAIGAPAPQAQNPPPAPEPQPSTQGVTPAAEQ